MIKIELFFISQPTVDIHKGSLCLQSLILKQDLASMQKLSHHIYIFCLFYQSLFDCEKQTIQQKKEGKWHTKLIYDFFFFLVRILSDTFFAVGFNPFVQKRSSSMHINVLFWLFAQQKYSPPSKKERRILFYFCSLLLLIFSCLTFAKKKHF